MKLSIIKAVFPPLFVLFLVLAGSFLGIDLTEEEHFWRRFLDSLHFFAFFTLAFVCLYSMGKYISSYMALILGVLFFGFFGLGIELVQPFFGRDYSLIDSLLNWLGSLSGGLLVVMLRSPKFKNKLIFISVLSLGILTAVWPVVKAWRNYELKSSTLPDLISSDPGGLIWWKGNEDKGFLEQKGETIVYTWDREKYPGIVYEALGQDWSIYSKLTLKIVGISEPQKLTVRIDDQGPSQYYSQRFNKELSLTPGENIIEIALRGDGEEKYVNYSILLTEVSFLYIFLGDQVTSGTFTLAEAKLSF